MLTKHQINWTLSVSLIVCTYLAGGTTLLNAQLKTVGKSCPPDQRKRIDQIDHAPFDQLLKKYVNSDGEVNYNAWKNNASDRGVLQSYLVALSKAEPKQKCSSASTLAYWINAYNAVTLEGILEVYPTSSIRNHTKTPGYNLWKDLKLVVADSSINLEDIEHKVLRKMNEPRIHFAIVCASTGCPRLMNEAFTAEKMETQLATNTRDFFSRKRNLNYDSSRNQLQLSAIMKWFGTDFGADQGSQIRSLVNYFPEPLKNVVRQGQYSVGYLDYDWSLNQQR